MVGSRARNSREAASLVKNKLSPSLVASAAGSCILITGAGGFIGSALATALAAGSPRLLVLLDNSERNLHELTIALRQQTSAPREAILGDVCDSALLAEIMERHRPAVIFHAAACKHVPLMETNPLAAMRTNAIGTWRLVQTLRHAGKTSRAAQLLLISTDKAVKPASVMGATKRVAELVLERERSSEMTLQTVRLGNVLGSHGSVVPLFSQQIARCGPVTVTHPEAERYFFTLAETVKLILCAAALTSGTFIPKLPAPLRITELAERMIREARDAGAAEVSVQFTAMRPGDKLREEFLNDRELPEPTEDQQLLRVRGPKIDGPKFDAEMVRLSEAVEQRQLGRAMEVLRQLVPEYYPSKVLQDLVHEASVAKS